MPKEPAYTRRLREYVSGKLSIDDLSALEQELFGDSDRAAALLYCALVENSLLRLIKEHLRPDLNSADRSELFETFERTTTLAYAIGLIGPISRRDLDLIRFLRNQFAHSRRPLRFGLKEVEDVC